ncbi:hypothetical protein ACSMFR_02565 [Listeria aquatica]|uniref:hypothetical protein n=1 Tax=Listeria aquatica TaxID=1494960 RepID=UPI003F71F418
MNVPMFMGKALTLEDQKAFANRQTEKAKIQERLNWVKYYRSYVDQGSVQSVPYSHLYEQVIQHIRQEVWDSEE